LPGVADIKDFQKFNCSDSHQGTKD